MLFTRRQWLAALLGAAALHLLLLFVVLAPDLYPVQPIVAPAPGRSLSLEPLGPAPEAAAGDATEIAQAAAVAPPEPIAVAPVPEQAIAPESANARSVQEATETPSAPGPAEIPEATPLAPSQDVPAPADLVEEEVVAEPLIIQPIDVATREQPPEQTTARELKPEPEKPAAKPGANQTRNQSGGPGHLSAEYLNQTRSQLTRFQRYPLAAQQDHIQGTVRLSFVINRQGRVTEIEARCDAPGGAVLEDAVRDMVLAAQPFAPIPESNRRERLRITMQIEFALP